LDNPDSNINLKGRGENLKKLKYAIVTQKEKNQAVLDFKSM
jgi:hypothetical protein